MFIRSAFFLIFLLVPAMIDGQEYSLSTGPRPESEITAAVNPRNPANLVVAAMNDTSENPGTADSRLSVYYSSDQGKNWRKSTFEGKVDPRPGTDFIGDPVLAFDDRGIAYLAHLQWIIPNQQVETHLYLSSSRDGGATWTPELVATGVDTVYDKPWIACDQSLDSPYRGSLYLAYVRVDKEGNHHFFNLFLQTKTGPDQAPQAPVRVNAGNYRITQSPGVFVDGKGRVFVAFIGNDDSGTGLFVARSSDGGKTFEPEVRISNVRMYYGNFRVLETIVNQDGLRRLYPCPQLTGDLSGGIYDGRLYLSWTDKEIGTTHYGLDVFLSFSDDGGHTWSPPVPVHQDKTPNRHQYYSSIAVNQNGKLLLGWYDRREDAANYKTHYFFAQSQDGGLTFESEQNISSAASDFRRIILKNDGFGIGEYNCLVASGAYAVPFWADGRHNNGDVQVFSANILLEESTAVLQRSGRMSDLWQVEDVMPNPSDNQFFISVNLKLNSKIFVSVYDLKGRLVLSVPPGRFPPGEHLIRLEAGHLPAGSYHCSVFSDFGVSTQLLTVF